jgi:putative ABC transport system permease protein
MTERVARATSDRRVTLLLLGGFAALAVLLAAVGLYGVIAFAVAERRREFAVRLALGAPAGGVLRMVVGRAMRPVLAGVVAGLLGALLLAGAVRSMLFGVSPTDPVAFGTAVAVLLATALVASLVPAWRAARIEPAAVLRGE